MFKTLRWRLTIWFVLLSLLVYVSVAALGMVFFHAGLTSAIDDELQELSRELLPTVDYDGRTLQLRAWPISGHRKSPIKMLASVQLFDTHGKLLQEYGTNAYNQLLKGMQEVTGEGYAKRSLSTPVTSSNGKLLGYLQIQLTTKLRDNAVHQFGFTMALIAPLLVFALGVSGFFFAGKAAQPIEETFSVLRQFISDAGHELQTPIAVISAATENLSVALDDTPHAQRLAIISRNTDRMAHLVRDLMLLAKVDARAATDKPKALINVDNIARHCAEEFQDRYNDKHIELAIGEIQPALIVGDQDALHRGLVNLLENALRYTNEGGKVTLSCKHAGRLVKLSVEDSGIGIPEEALPHLFDRFYRVDKSRSREAGGVGLGLAIVKAIADSHRGYVEVSSEVGKGSRFCIVLPTATA